MAGTGSRPLSESPEAIRQRRFRENRRNGHGSGAANANAAPSSSPSHETSPIDGDGPEQFSGSPFLDEDADNPRPFVPPEPIPEPVAQPGPTLVTPEEAAMIGKAVAAYFEFGSGMLLVKQPEFASGLLQIAGAGDLDTFRKNFAIAKVFVGKMATEVALKYNLRIPYGPEIVTLGAIGIATFGLAGKPTPAGAKQMADLEQQQRAANAKDANPKPGDPPTTPTTPPPADEEELDLG